MDRQINIITGQLKTEVNTGSKKVKAYWVARWRHTGKPLIATGRVGDGRHMAAQCETTARPYTPLIFCFSEEAAMCVPISPVLCCG